MLKSLSHENVASFISESPIKDAKKSKYSLSKSVLKEERSVDEVSENVMKA